MGVVLVMVGVETLDTTNSRVGVTCMTDLEEVPTDDLNIRLL